MINFCIKENKLKMAVNKTKAVVIMGRIDKSSVVFNIRGSRIESKNCLKYLGI